MAEGSTREVGPELHIGGGGTHGNQDRALRELLQSPFWRRWRSAEQARNQNRESIPEIPIPRHGVTVARDHAEALTMGAALFHGGGQPRQLGYGAGGRWVT
jgi:hypothetical protein